MRIGSQVAAMIRRSGLKVPKVAERSKLSRQRIYEIIGDKRGSTSLDTLERIAKACSDHVRNLFPPSPVDSMVTDKQEDEVYYRRLQAILEDDVHREIAIRLVDSVFRDYISTISEGNNKKAPKKVLGR